MSCGASGPGATAGARGEGGRRPRRSHPRQPARGRGRRCVRRSAAVAGIAAAPDPGCGRRGHRAARQRASARAGARARRHGQRVPRARRRPASPAASIPAGVRQSAMGRPSPARTARACCEPTAAQDAPKRCGPHHPSIAWWRPTTADPTFVPAAARAVGADWMVDESDGAAEPVLADRARAVNAEGDRKGKARGAHDGASRAGAGRNLRAARSMRGWSKSTASAGSPGRPAEPSIQQHLGGRHGWDPTDRQVERLPRGRHSSPPELRAVPSRSAGKAPRPLLEARPTACAAAAPRFRLIASGVLEARPAASAAAAARAGHPAVTANPPLDAGAPRGEAGERRRSVFRRRTRSRSGRTAMRPLGTVYLDDVPPASSA